MSHIKAIAYDNESIHFRPLLVLCHTTISLTNIVVDGVSVVVDTFFAITLWKLLPQNITYGNDKSSTLRDWDRRINSSKVFSIVTRFCS